MDIALNKIIKLINIPILEIKLLYKKGIPFFKRLKRNGRIHKMH